MDIYHGRYPTSISYLLSFFDQWIVGYWFLWAAFWCSVFTAVVCRFTPKKFWGATFAAAILISLLTPDTYNFDCYKFMFPCYLIGAFAYDSRLVKRMESFSYTVWVGLAVFVFLFVFFKRESYIYVSGWSLTGKTDKVSILLWDIYRILIGTVGSGLVLCLVSRMNEKAVSIMGGFGRSSTGIYIISIYLGGMTTFVFSCDVPKVLLAAVMVIAILMISYLITWVLSKNKWVGLFFLGNKFWK